MMMCGGFGNVNNADESVQQLANSVRDKVEERLNAKFNTYDVVSYKTQVVAGTNYKVKIHIGNESYVHIKIFVGLYSNGGSTELTQAEGNMTIDSQL